VLPADIDFRKLGFSGPVKARDIWEMKDMGTISGPMSVKIPAHGVLFLRVRQ
jgi:alpha-galactosidase